MLQSSYLQKLKELDQKSQYHMERPDSFYDSLIQKELEVEKDFFKFWLNCQVPVHIMRYEDLILDFVGTMKQTCEFLFCADSLKETILESKILTFFKFNKNLNVFVDEFEMEAKNLFKIFTVIRFCFF